MTKSERLSAARRKKKADPGQQQKSGAAKPTYVSTDKKKMKESKDHPKNVKGIAKELDKAVEMHKSQAKRLRKAGISEGKDKKGKGSGSKDACYHKVKSRYSVWPSAYASGALVKCRKVGAANWGNSSKKEEFEMSDWRSELNEKCWKGYEKKGMKTMFGKRYPNCVKKTKKEELQLVSKTPLDEKMGCMHTHKGEECPVHGKKECPEIVAAKMDEAVRVPAKTGNIVNAYFKFRSNYISLKMFFPQTSVPNKADVQSQVEKVYPGARLLSFQISDYEPGEPVLHTEDWQKKSGKNPEGGLNEKGRKSYERQNPGSDLKRPSKKVGNKRRASFCARMKGMKKKLTSSKTANDPDSRINKSLRAWNC